MWRIQSAILCIVALALAARTYQDNKHLRLMNQTSLPQGGRAFDALDVQGRPYSATASDVDQFIVFVLHERQLDAELPLWRAAQKGLPPRTRLLGVCAEDACAARLKSSAETPFPVVHLGAYQALLTAMRHDAAGQVAVLSREGYFVRALPRPSQAAELLAALRGGQDASAR